MEEYFKEIETVFFGVIYLAGIFYIIAGEYVEAGDIFAGVTFSFFGVIAISVSIKKVSCLFSKISSVHQEEIFFLMILLVFVFRFLIVRFILWITKKEETKEIDSIFINENSP